MSESHRTDAPDILMVPTNDPRQSGDNSGIDTMNNQDISANVTVETSRTNDHVR